jgi:hypothetical protein
VSDHVLSPGFTKYDARMQYVVVDVKSLVAQGGLHFFIRYPLSLFYHLIIFTFTFTFPLSSSYLSIPFSLNQ